MFKFLAHRAPKSDEHNDKRLARHRYEHPPIFYPDLGTHHHRTHRHPTHTHHGSIHAEMLQLHNHHRARHCASPLIISQRLNQIAQSYADHLAATSKFEHSGDKLGEERLGENLYMEWISRGRVKTSAKAAVKIWYDEIALHDFERPVYSAATGHFTQMVWKSSKKLGVGVALSPNGREVYIVTNYYPAGNITNSGYFRKNVLPPNC